MQFQTTNAAPTGFQPVSITLTFETPDDLRWFYHLMNFQMKEIQAAYEVSRKGNFADRFRTFDVPDKKELYRFIKAQAADQGVALDRGYADSTQGTEVGY